MPSFGKKRTATAEEFVANEDSTNVIFVPRHLQKQKFGQGDLAVMFQESYEMYISPMFKQKLQTTCQSNETKIFRGKSFE